MFMVDLYILYILFNVYFINFVYFMYFVYFIHILLSAVQHVDGRLALQCHSVSLRVCCCWSWYLTVQPCAASRRELAAQFRDADDE